MTFQIEIVWNREFHFVTHSQPHEDIEYCILRAKALENMGDGAVVKKTRIVNEQGKVVWQYGKKVQT